MPKILIVEDERDYRDQLSTVLSWENYDVCVASSGREAIDIGARYRPDVLVTDWMLRDQIHGLHVIEVLRAVDHSVRSILVTGFASDDLRSAAESRGICAFIEKPFDLERFQNNVRFACEQDPPGLPSISIALLELDDQNDIRYANARAKQLIREFGKSSDIKCWDDFFPDGNAPDLEQACQRWVASFPDSDGKKTWHIRTQPIDSLGSRFVAIAHGSGPRYMNNHVLQMLLDFKEDLQTVWPDDKRVLVVDDDSLQRHFAVSQLEGAGAGCYAAETHEKALRLFETDEGISYVILDYDMPGSDPAVFVKRLRELRPSVQIVGNSGDDRRDDFQAMGVSSFLFKPWPVAELISLTETSAS